MNSAILIIPLLLFSFLTHQAQGVGLTRKEVNSTWKSKNLSGTGRARKLLITSPIPTTATIAKNEKVENKDNSGRKEEHMSVEKRPAAAEAEEKYPSVLDLAGMDYSQARRKPPIHN